MDKAKIYTYSILFASTEEFKDRVPYLTAILEKPDGKRFASLIAGWNAGTRVEIGQEVHSSGTDAGGQSVYSL
ncbi:MAG: OB-fold domain-containing protein [Deltaproteobacteria bacterium]|jgi:uncharacterized OB-fold protein|nr:OB-fold domain-containing protein [Deltaproteobacteria bacterium]